MNSTSLAEVFKIDRIEKHPNADKLSLVWFYNYSCIVRTEDFKVGDLAVYIPPDNIVDLEHPSFEFLKKMNKGARIKCQKLRGVMSQGLVMPCPPGYNEGDNLNEQWNIKHYVSQENIFGIKSVGSRNEFAICPPYNTQQYDIESWFRYSNIFLEGETVRITEKIHGMNASYTYQQGEYYCKSRNYWRKENPDCIYWKILNQRKWLKRLLKNNPNMIVFGEIYGPGIQELTYGLDKPSFLVFDIYDPVNYIWWNWEKVYEEINKSLQPNWFENCINWLFGKIIEKKLIVEDLMVPVLCKDIYSKDLVLSYISGNTAVKNIQENKTNIVISNPIQLREGIVIKPVNERYCELRERSNYTGRCILKAVSPEYLERTK